MKEFLLFTARAFVNYPILFVVVPIILYYLVKYVRRRIVKPTELGHRTQIKPPTFPPIDPGPDAGPTSNFTEQELIGVILPPIVTSPGKPEGVKPKHKNFGGDTQTIDKPIIGETTKKDLLETLPEPDRIAKEDVNKNLYVNYQSAVEENLETLPIIRFPKKGCIIRTHRFGKTNIRGYKEESFQDSIERYFGSHFTVSGEVRLNTGKETRPYEPDIAMIDTKSGKNIRIDIEIDEPYAGITRQATHCKGEDLLRDIYFSDRGWIVIRFSEYQVHRHEKECLKQIGAVIKSINNAFDIPNELNSTNCVSPEKLWDVVQGSEMEKEEYGEKYLGHTFEKISKPVVTAEWKFSEQEKQEELEVNSTKIGEADSGKAYSYNIDNAYERDKRAKFYPEDHIYTIDGISAPSASTIISKFFPVFDAYEAIRKMKAGSNWNSYNKYWRKYDHEIKEEWEAKGEKAAQEGTYLHEQIEKFYLEQEFERPKEFRFFEKFVNDHSNLKPYRTEWRIFDEQYHIAGTVDLIAKNGADFEIYDWKRSKKVVNPVTGKPICVNTWQSGIGALNHIQDTSYNRYCLQQSLYRYILEKNYDLKISKMYLVVLYPEYDRYYKVEVPYQKKKQSIF